MAKRKRTKARRIQTLDSRSRFSSFRAEIDISSFEMGSVCERKPEKENERVRLGEEKKKTEAKQLVSKGRVSES